jgi:hypothetical protein
MMTTIRIIASSIKDNKIAPSSLKLIFFTI